MEGERSGPGAERGDLPRQIGRLKLGLAALAVLWVGTVGWMVVAGSSNPGVLSAERLEIVEPDGRPAFVLANSEHPEPAIVDGEVLLAGQEEERRNPSFIFFDGKGDEVGGMLFRNEETEEGFSAVRHLSLDGYKQDQTVVLHHYQGPGGASSGLRVTDRPRDRTILEAMAELGLEPGHTREELNEAIEAIPEEEREERLRELFGARRLYLGSSRDDQATLTLRDGREQPRIILGVPEEGEPFIRILDEEGETVLELPGDTGSSSDTSRPSTWPRGNLRR